jgi:hypothetical protein
MGLVDMKDLLGLRRLRTSNRVEHTHHRDPDQADLRSGGLAGVDRAVPIGYSVGGARGNGAMSLIRVTAVLVVSLGLAASAPALPAFARRYQVACQLCHTGYPRLNEVGQRFKERGFRLEREDRFAAKRWIDSVPLSARAEASQRVTEKADDDSIGRLRLQSAGNLGGRLSYWIDDGIELRNGDTVSHAGPDNLYVRYEVQRTGKLYVKAGRMERDLPFTQARSPHVVPYEIYAALGVDGLAGHRDGIEVGSDLPHGLHLSSGLLLGVNGAVESDGGVFLRASKRFGQQGKQRFGVLGEWGAKAPPGSTSSPPPSERDGLNVHRFGLDFDLSFDRINIYGLYVYGRYGSEPVVQGGFLHTDYQLDRKVSLTLRGQLLSYQPSASKRQQSLSVVPGIQVFVASRLKLSFGYSFWNSDRPSEGQLQAEVAF